MECPRCEKELEAGANGAARCIEHGVFLPASALARDLVMPRVLPGEPSVGCPRCSTMMREVRLDDIRLDACSGCDAWWFDHGEIEQIRNAIVTHGQRRLLWAGIAMGATGGWG